MKTEYLLGDIINGTFESFDTLEEASQALEWAISDGTRENIEHMGEDGCPWQSEEDCRDAAESFFYVIERKPGSDDVVILGTTKIH